MTRADENIGLSLETIERLWRAAVPTSADDDWGPGIEIVDAQSLQSRGHILFVTHDGNGHCLTLSVFANYGGKRKAIWRLSELPGNAGGICHEQMLAYPTAYARPPGDIIVQVPTGPVWLFTKKEGPDLATPISTALMIYTYRWSGATYKLTSSRKIVTYKTDTFSEEKCTRVAPCVR